MQKISKNNKLYVISGSSGVGKGTVIKHFLAKHPDFILSTSYTTRTKREGEQEGVNYFYTTKEDFKKCIENNEFIEWAEFSENFYGTKRKFVEEILSTNKNIILEIDTQGALQIKKKMPNSVLIFIAPPSYQDLEFRLRNRNTETEEAIAKRLEFVKLEIENSKFFDYIIVNDQLDLAIKEFEKIVKTNEAYND